MEKKGPFGKNLLNRVFVKKGAKKGVFNKAFFGHFSFPLGLFGARIFKRKYF